MEAYVGAGAVFALAALLVRVLVKTDGRWIRIVDSQDEDIKELKAEVRSLRDEMEEVRKAHKKCESDHDTTKREVQTLKRQLAEVAETRPPNTRTRREDTTGG